MTLLATVLVSPPFGGGMFEAIMKQDRSHFTKGSHPKATIEPTATAIEPFLLQGWIWQQKINGRRLQVVLLADGSYQAWTRQGHVFSLKIPCEVIGSLLNFFGPSKKWTIIEGEWLKGKLYLFDILVQEGVSLTNLTYKERHKLLKRDYILPYMQLLPIKTSLKEALQILNDKDSIVEGIVLKSPHPGITDHHIVRCRKKEICK